MGREFGLIVIGSGAAGASAAYQCRSAGWSVAVIDSRPFGGTCALRGCDPKKVLVGATEVIERTQQMAGKGVTCHDVKIDWQAAKSADSFPARARARKQSDHMLLA